MNSYEPVRSKFNGHLYDRDTLYKWLDERHTDPIEKIEYVDAAGLIRYKGKPATRLDYVPAPVARRRAHEVAAWLHADRAYTP